MRASGKGPGTPWYSDNKRWGTIAVEVAGSTVLMIAYFLLRGLRPDDIDSSVSRSLHLIRFEQQVGLFQEVRWQEAFIGHEVLMSIANVFYAWGHYPVMLAIGIYLVLKDPLRYRFLRNVLLVSAVLGVVTYYLLPAAPPRLMAAHGYDFGFIDTVHGATSDVAYFNPGPFVNNYAALPSFHFGWIALSSAAIWMNTGRWSLRALAVALSLTMWWAVTVTGNHYFFDMIFGAVVVGVSWLVVAMLAEAPLPARVARLIGVR
jgi:hypothetical protein